MFNEMVQLHLKIRQEANSIHCKHGQDM